MQKVNQSALAKIIKSRKCLKKQLIVLDPIPGFINWKFCKICRCYEKSTRVLSPTILTGMMKRCLEYLYGPQTITTMQRNQQIVTPCRLMLIRLYWSANMNLPFKNRLKWLKLGVFWVLQKSLLVPFCVVVWVLFSVDSVNFQSFILRYLWMHPFAMPN